MNELKKLNGDLSYLENDAYASNRIAKHANEIKELSEKITTLKREKESLHLKPKIYKLIIVKIIILTILI